MSDQPEHLSHRPDIAAADDEAADDEDGEAISSASETAVDPLQLWRSRAATDGDGTYVRDAEGSWYDARTAGPVAAARDLTLAELYDPVQDQHDGKPVRVVPRAWASRHPDHPLAWVFSYAEPGDRGPITVPAEAWDARAHEPVAMSAPELHPLNLVGIDGVAQLVGVTEATVRSYLARRQMPDPIVRVGGSPVWPRAVIERWLATRRASPAPRPSGAS